jgi:predicted ester cyclase
MGWLALTQRIFPDFHAIVEDEIAEGDRVVQRITCYGTHQGEFSGVRPTGEQVAFSSIEINRAGKDGKFTEHWSSADLLGVLHRPRLAAAIPAASR